MTIWRAFWLGFLALTALFASTPGKASSGVVAACPERVSDRFDPSRDLLVVNYDIKPDVDDLHSAAAFATFVNRFPACFDFVVVAGTYGNQDGNFIQAPGLLNLAFGKRWLNAHDHRLEAAQAIAKRMGKTLRAGGSVWIAEGGQSDFTADIVAKLAAERTYAPLLRQRVHVVQHSDWNEQATTPAKLSYLEATVDYRRIADGNAAGNGTPGFAADDPSWWPRLLSDPRSGAIWAEAKRLADQANSASAYVNPAVAKGGVDFSDTVEVAYIFGLETIADHEGFFRMVLDPSVLVPPYDAFPPQITRYMANPAILVFSKTSDWRHNEGIAGADRYFADLASSRGWGIFTTANGAVFRPEILSRFKLIVFNNMTGDVLSPAQRLAFEGWMASGGAWIGLHGAGDNSHTSWRWYDQQLIGPEFIGHPANPQFQKASLATLAPEHPVMAGFPSDWAATDEWYSFDAHPSAFGMKPLLGLSEASYDPVNRQYGPREDLRMGPKPADHPVIWTRCLGNARSFYSALGHQQFLYDDPHYRQLLANAVDWVLDRKSTKGC
jgi:uncharacterized protein